MAKQEPAEKEKELEEDYMDNLDFSDEDTQVMTKIDIAFLCSRQIDRIARLKSTMSGNPYMQENYRNGVDVLHNMIFNYEDETFRKKYAELNEISLAKLKKVPEKQKGQAIASMQLEFANEKLRLLMCLFERKGFLPVRTLGKNVEV